MEIIARGQITIWNYKDGDDAYSVILNHDTHAVACDPSGNALGGELGPSGKAVFALSAYKGATKLTMRYSSAASTADMCAWKFGTISGCTAAQMSGSNEKFYINTMTADSAYVEIVCSVDGKASITKRVTVVKQKKGDTGDPGKPGDDGKQGCMLRPRGTWTAQTQYVYNDQYRDVVLYNNSVYIVKATHTSAVSFDSSKWEPFNEFVNVATSVLLANKGYIDVLGAARLFVGDTNKSTGWEMTNGYIKHTKSGLTLTADGKLYDPDGLHLSVGGKTVQAIVDGAVDEIQIGGRNYLRNSAFEKNTDYWGADNISISVDSTSKRENVNTLKIVQNSASDTNLSSIRLYQNSNKLNPTSLSFWAKADRPVNIKVRVGSNPAHTKTFAINTNWQRCVYEDINPASDAVVFGALSACTWWLSEPMQNEGTKASDWTPAPEDITSKIEENSSKIEQLPDQISISVDQKIKNIQVGNRNILLNSGKVITPANNAYHIHTYNTSIELIPNGKYTIVLKGSTSAGQKFGFWVNSGMSALGSLTANMNNDVAYLQVTMPSSFISGWSKSIMVYNVPNPNSASKPCSIEWTAMYEGHIKPPMDWTPAPEDTDAAISSLSSEIKQTADNISLKVNQVIGGTNLLSNTSFSADLNGWSLLNSSTGMTAKIVSKGGYQCLELWTDGARRGLYAYLDNRSLVKAGDKFTISFDLYRTSSAVSTLAIGLEDGGADFIKKTLSGNLNTWVRLTYTQTMDTNNAAFIIYGAGNAGTVYIKNIKVEMGTIATAWTPSPLEQNNKLLATGIDIYNKRIDITADKLRIKNNSGTPIAVFDGSGSTPKLKAANIDVDNLKVKHLDGADGTFKGSLSAATGTFSGTITAGSVFSGRLQSPTGNIGDLEISGGYLSSNGGGKKGIAFTSNYMSNYFENISSQKTITMDPGDGYGAKPYTFTLLGNRKAEVRKSNTSVNHIYVADMMNIQYTGFLKDSRYGFQYAMLGSGHCILDGVVDGGCWGHIAFEENNTFEQINPHLIGNRIIITPSYSNNYVILPTLVKMHMFLGQDIAQRVSRQFTYVITIINQSTNAVAIMGRANTTIGSLNLNNSQFPKFYNQSGTLMDQPREYTIKPFCARQFMLAYDGGEFYAFEL